jgi:uncharacterized membrane protein YtjA (UPF0391 family)/uncharacterized membrane protein YeaQ/YmgE (transglycosylase-associated protein family)
LTLLELLVLLVIASLAGGIGQAISGYSIGGCLVSIVVGYVGAFIGLWLARQFGLPELLPITIGGETFPFIWSILGSALLTLILGLITRRRPIAV